MLISGFILPLPTVLATECVPGDFKCDGNSLKLCSKFGIWKTTECPSQMKCSNNSNAIGCVLNTKNKAQSKKLFKENLSPKLEIASRSSTEDKKPSTIANAEHEKDSNMDVSIKSNKKKIEDANEKFLRRKRIFDSSESSSDEETHFLRLLEERQYLADYLRENQESILLSEGFLPSNGSANNLKRSFMAMGGAMGMAKSACGSAKNAQSAQQAQAKTNASNQQSCAQKVQASAQSANKNMATQQTQANSMAAKQQSCSQKAQAASNSANQSQASAQAKMSGTSSSQSSFSMQQALKQANSNSSVANKIQDVQTDLSKISASSNSRAIQQAKANVSASYQNKSNQEKEANFSYQSEQRAAQNAKANKDTAFQNKATEEIVMSAETQVPPGQIEEENPVQSEPADATSDQNINTNEQKIATGDSDLSPEPEQEPGEITASYDEKTRTTTISEPIPVESIENKGKFAKRRARGYTKRKVCRVY